MSIDPICGMTIDPNKTPFRSEYQGNAVYFCSLGCKKTFDKDPANHMPRLDAR